MVFTDLTFLLSIAGILFMTGMGISIVYFFKKKA